MQFVINPGTEPVADANETDAIANIVALIEDAKLNGFAVWKRNSSDDGGGRFAFDIHHSNGNSCDVDMPGLPLSRVRFVGEDGQNIWNFPRLYVGGSSWVWKFAVNILRGQLEDKDADTNVAPEPSKRGTRGQSKTK